MYICSALYIHMCLVGSKGTKHITLNAHLAGRDGRAQALRQQERRSFTCVGRCKKKKKNLSSEKL